MFTLLHTVLCNLYGKKVTKFKSSTSTTWTVTCPYLAQTVHTCSSHPEPLQNIGTHMQTTCTSVKTAVMASSSKANWNPIVKYTLKWLALCALSQNVTNASRGNRSKKDIKCEHCDNSNQDIRNIHAHSKVHSNRLLYHCPLCQKGFKWQQQKQ